MKQIPVIDDPIADDVDYLAFFLDPALHADHRCRHDGSALRLEPVRPEYAIRDACLIFNRDEEDALCRTRFLSNKDDAGDLDMATVSDAREIRATGHASPRQFVADECERMGAQ